MTRVIETKSNRSLSAVFATGLVACVLLPVGTFAGSARADEFQNDIRIWEPDNNVGNGKGGGIYYFAPPPAAYATPFTGTPLFPPPYPPPVFYGPSMGFCLDGPRIGADTP
jgi:hypothetical protein